MPWDYGSRYQLRRWILERPDEVNGELMARNPQLKAWAREIEWISPTVDKVGELRDEAWRQIGLPGRSPHAAGWWPARGAVWDAIARVRGPDGEIGGIFVEAKGRIGELRSGGCKATDPESLATIHSAIADVQAHLGVPPSPTWMGTCYQPANRLAVLWYAREHVPSVDVWLVSLYFLGEHYPTVIGTQNGPTSEAAWRPVIDALHAEMALPAHPHVLSDWCIEAFLPALQPNGGWLAPQRGA